MNVLDLFSGIGGFSLGLERAGMRTVAFCEIDHYCRAVLRKHWPGIPIFDDVRKLTAKQIGPVDVISGGFPCQPYSVAGNQLAAADDRALWPEYRRLVEELGPSWVIGENVIGLVELGLDAVLDDLEALGYATRTFDIPACATGKNHIRRRVWIVAHRESLHGIAGAGERAGADDPRHPKGAGQPPCNDRSEQEQFGRASGWDDRPIPEPSIRRVDDGFSSRVDRIGALGNAVVPQIPEIIGRAIMSTTRLKSPQ